METPILPTGPSSSSTRTWTVLCHASSLLGFFVPLGGHLVPPLVIWLVKRTDSPEVDRHGRESLNFQLSMCIYGAVAVVLCLALIGFVILPLLHILNAVFAIIASVKAGDGEFFRYPFTIRFLS